MSKWRPDIFLSKQNIWIISNFKVGQWCGWNFQRKSFAEFHHERTCDLSSWISDDGYWWSHWSNSFLPRLIALFLSTLFRLLYGRSNKRICKNLTSLFSKSLNPLISVFQTSNIAEGAYNSRWYRGRIGYQKLMVLVIARSQREQHLTAYKFGTASMEAFWKVCGSKNEIQKLSLHHVCRSNVKSFIFKDCCNFMEIYNSPQNHVPTLTKKCLIFIWCLTHFSIHGISKKNKKICRNCVETHSFVT